MSEMTDWVEDHMFDHELDPPEPYIFEGEVRQTTLKAVLVKIGTSTEYLEVWLPRSQCHFTPDNPTIGAQTEVTVPVWLAEEKEMERFAEG